MKNFNFAGNIDNKKTFLSLMRTEKYIQVEYRSSTKKLLWAFYSHFSVLFPNKEDFKGREVGTSKCFVRRRTRSRTMPKRNKRSEHLRSGKRLTVLASTPQM